MRRSIRTQLVISFFAVMLPVVLFLIANNWYAKNVVHDKVSETYRNTLDIFVGQLDLYMEEINDYLYKLAVLDADVGLLAAFPVDSDNYVLTKVRVQNKINRDVGFYNLLHTVFIYNKNDIIFSSSGNYGQVKQLLAQEAPRIAAQHRQMLDGTWMLWENDLMPGRDFLVRLTPSENNQYIGAIISISDILDLLRIQWDDDKIGESAVYSREGVRMADPLSFTDRTLPIANLPLLDTPYQIVGQGENRHLVMIRTSSMADIAVAVAVPEKQMLQGLPYFQKAVYFIVLGLVFLFSMYLLFIQRTVFQPLHQLINGMKKLSLGMLDFRLKTTNTVEFQFMANTFNNMAEQISNLRIGMYEEQLRAQKNEMKQLQAQINPHFYMNSLNIIYNFAVLKDHDSVKKMALHMADYFRFIMRVNRESITLEEELKHIGNYVEIQKFRFPEKLECIVDIPERWRTAALPALTLQPFVENAIIHGFLNRREKFIIRIHGEIAAADDGDKLVIVIRDNGVGFHPDVLDRLRRGEELPASESSRLGIANVVQRLKLRYEGGAGVEFDNDPGGGAVVRVRLPLPAELSTERTADISVIGEADDVQSVGRG
ncbi:MAG: two-component sensor histidine kinase [Paenibacillaceae bacterium]|nr:MAG: two-component sensor histidine kinase [Paenibacillaceae bacterium]